MAKVQLYAFTYTNDVSLNRVADGKLVGQWWIYICKVKFTMMWTKRFLNGLESSFRSPFNKPGHPLRRMFLRKSQSIHNRYNTLMHKRKRAFLPFHPQCDSRKKISAK